MEALDEDKLSENSCEVDQENTNINTEHNITPKVHNLQFKPNNYNDSKVVEMEGGTGQSESDNDLEKILLHNEKQ